MIREAGFMTRFYQRVADFQQFVARKGKVPPNKYRAAGQHLEDPLRQKVQTGQ